MTATIVGELVPDAVGHGNMIALTTPILGTTPGQLWERVSETAEHALADLAAEKFNNEWAGDGYIAHVGTTIRGEIEFEVELAGYDVEYVDSIAELWELSGRIHAAQDRFLERHI